MLLAGLAPALAGCVSVPLTTMARMSTFDDRDFVGLQAEVLRVRIGLPEGFELDARRSSLGVRISSEAGVHQGTFTLEPLAAERTRLARGLFAAERWGTAYTLKLSPQARDEFRRLQAFVRRGHPGDVLIAVAPILSSFPPAAESVNVWIDLLLSPQQGYFTLLEAAEVPMEAIRAASTRS